MKKLKSIFFRFMAAFLLINVICFAVMSFTISSVLTEYGADIKAHSLFDSAKTFFEFARYECEKDGNSENSLDVFDRIKNDEAYSEKLTEMMNFFSKEDGKTVFIITDGSGDVIGYGGTDVGISDVLGKEREERNYRLPESVISELKDKNNAEYYDVQDSMKRFIKPGRICSIYPVYENGNLDGTVISVTDIYGETDTIVSEMNTTVLTSALWIMIAMLIITYFVLHRLISPIREMSRAAKAFAVGQFDVRVTVTGDDEISELATAFNNMASSMQTMEDMRRSFLANVSHDLRTPMTTISGFIDGILDGAIPPEKHEYYLGIIASEVRRLSRLVSQLLDISRLEAGERKFEPQTYDICEQGREIIIANVQRLEEKNLDVRFECDRDNMYVFADKDAMHQIFYNICDNAIKFSKDGGIYEIKITEKDEKITVSVYNEGKGIPKDDLPNIFERFYKSDKSRGRDKSGVGLGMYIARTIMEACGEKIWVESEEGQWCRFTFTLQPAKQKKARREER